MKNKKVLIIVAAAVVVILGAVGGFLVFSGKSKPAQPVAQQDQVVPTLMPEDIGLTLSLITSGKFANNGVLVKVTKLTDIASMDYELAYTSTGDIPRGAIGHVDVKPTDSVFTQELPFGTCSDKCHFDTGVKDVKLTLKITKKDGSEYQVESPFNF